MAIRIVLLLLIAYALSRPDLPQFQKKAMPVRSVLYPLATMIVPVAWCWYCRRRRPVAFPWGLDILVALPPLIDAAGNAFDLYDSVWWWDDFNHFLNPFLLSMALGQLLLYAPLGRFTTGALLIGFGAVVGILWELAEYWAFVRRSPEFNTAYEDTIGDLTLDLLGCVTAALITSWLLWPRRRAA
ncbi:MAG: hypothetical protein AB7V46_03920 [Thermomicrobiales bacterium]